MRKVKKRNAGITLAVVMILAALTAKPDVAYGAVGIDTDAECSMTFTLSVNDLVIQSEEPPSGFEEISDLPIEIELYKAADVDESGKYVEPEDGSKAIYNALKERLSTENSDSDSVADKWLSMAEDAARVIEESSDAVVPVRETTLNDPESESGNKIEGLSTGLYLVVARDVQSEECIYQFTPYLVSLPGRHYKKPGDSGGWEYDVTVSLKPGKADGYGDLEITKSLKTYNETLGGAACVFQIVAKKGDKVVYSDVKSIVFHQAGQQTIRIEKEIPIGAQVTVTEVYSGSSYEAEVTEQSTFIEVDKVASVEFANDYNHRPNSGSSIVNHFVDTAAGDSDQAEEKPSVWEGIQLVDSNQEPQKSGGAAADEE